MRRLAWCFRSIFRSVPVTQNLQHCYKIQVTGTAVPAKEAEAEKNVPKAEHYMRLTAIKIISTTCP